VLAVPRLRSILTVALLLGCPLSASANFRYWFGRPSVSAYYYPAPAWPSVYMVPVQPVCVPMPAVSVPGVRLLAQPVAAPPSSDSEPPRARLQTTPEEKKPRVRDSNYYDAYAVATNATSKSTEGRCSVSFWNVSDKALVLKVDGRRLSLARGRSVTLDLDRQFTWQIEGREEHAQTVAKTEHALDILIRR
jgi:hypothetical protein